MRWPNPYQLGYIPPLFFNQQIRFEAPISNERPFLSPPSLRNVPSAASSRSQSPLPGSEEYTQRNIQQASDRIKRQLNLTTESDETTCDIDTNDKLNTTVNTDVSGTESKKDNEPLCEISEKSPISDKVKQVKKPVYSVQEICDKIISHISNLNDGKKKNLIHVGSAGYDEAIKQIQRKERLELSRALRDMRSQQMQDTSEVINSIIPDFGIKVEDLPPEIIEQLSTTLNLDPEEHFGTYQSRGENVDPELLFKQAETMLSMEFDESVFTNVGADPTIPNSVSEKKPSPCSTSSLEGVSPPEKSSPVLSPIVCAQ